jgi:hypothetical protein
VLGTALGSWGKHREGDPKVWSTVLVTALSSVLRKHREGDPRWWSTVLITALSSSLGKPDPRGHSIGISMQELRANAVKHGRTSMFLFQCYVLCVLGLFLRAQTSAERATPLQNLKNRPKSAVLLK